MTNANEMAQKGFDTGFTDANDNELHVGDYVRICGHIGKIVFSCGAFGIFIADEVPWDALEELVRKDSGNRPSFLYNDTFISFWEIVWNLSEDTDEPCLPYVESITATGGIFTDENGNKDVLSVPRERFLDIASKLDSLAFDDDPYEYHDNEGVESISDIADNLLNPTYRKAIIKALQDKQEYYAEDEFDDANIAERAKDILDNLAEIFGSDEQED